MNGRNKKDPKCAQCRNHGVEVLVRGHKYSCKYQICICEKCISLAAGNRRYMNMYWHRRMRMRKRMHYKRRLKEKYENENMSFNSGTSYEVITIDDDDTSGELNFSVETINSNTSGPTSSVSTMATIMVTPQFSPMDFIPLHNQTPISNNPKWTQVTSTGSGIFPRQYVSPTLRFPDTALPQHLIFPKVHFLHYGSPTSLPVLMSLLTAKPA